MKFRPQQIRDVVDRQLLPLLQPWAQLPHWDFGQNGAVLDDSILNQLVDPPRSMRFRRFDAVGFLWLWAIIDSHPDDPKSGCLLVMKPYKDVRFCQYGVATKPSGKAYGTVGPLYLHLQDALEWAGFTINMGWPELRLLWSRGTE